MSEVVAEIIVTQIYKNNWSRLKYEWILIVSESTEKRNYAWTKWGALYAAKRAYKKKQRAKFVPKVVARREIRR